jgi:hypothetical protein
VPPAGTIGRRILRSEVRLSRTAATVRGENSGLVRQSVNLIASSTSPIEFGLLCVSDPAKPANPTRSEGHPPGDYSHA